MISYDTSFPVWLISLNMIILTFIHIATNVILFYDWKERKWKWSHSVIPTLSDSMDWSPPGSARPGKGTGVGCYFLLQGIFLTQGSNPGLPHCRQTLYHLSHLEGPMDMSLSKLREMVKSSMLQVMRSQRIQRDLATEQQQKVFYWVYMYIF